MSRPAPTLAVLVLLAALASACAPGRPAGPAPLPAPRVVLLVDAATAALLPALPPGAELEQAAGQASALAKRYLELAAEPSVAAIVAWPALPGTAAAMARARESRPGLLLYAGYEDSAGAEEALLLESAADLVVGGGGARSAAALAELARRAATGPARSDDIDEFLASLRAVAPGRGWTAEYRPDPASGVRARNHLRVSSPPEEGAIVK